MLGFKTFAEKQIEKKGRHKRKAPTVSRGRYNRLGYKMDHLCQTGTALSQVPDCIGQRETPSAACALNNLS